MICQCLTKFLMAISFESAVSKRSLHCRDIPAHRYKRAGTKVCTAIHLVIMKQENSKLPVIGTSLVIAYPY